ncbi:hypothetical protein [Ferrovibrio sp.]
MNNLRARAAERKRRFNYTLWALANGLGYSSLIRGRYKPEGGRMQP